MTRHKALLAALAAAVAAAAFLLERDTEPAAPRPAGKQFTAAELGAAVEHFLRTSGLSTLPDWPDAARWAPDPSWPPDIVALAAGRARVWSAARALNGQPPFELDMSTEPAPARADGAPAAVWLRGDAVVAPAPGPVAVALDAGASAEALHRLLVAAAGTPREAAGLVLLGGTATAPTARAVSLCAAFVRDAEPACGVAAPAAEGAAAWTALARRAALMVRRETKPYDTTMLEWPEADGTWKDPAPLRAMLRSAPLAPPLTVVIAPDVPLPRLATLLKRLPDEAQWKAPALRLVPELNPDVPLPPRVQTVPADRNERTEPADRRVRRPAGARRGR